MRVAMVSGAGRGLGRAIAVRLTGAGWTVSAGLRDHARAPQGCAGFRFDATDPPTAGAWVEATIARFGRIDAVVNNAGILRMVTFDQGSEADLDLMWQVNAKAPFRLLKAAMPHLRASGRGRVVNIASTDGKRVRDATVSAGYAMTKHALIALTHYVRMAGHADGVRATALCPGAIDTEMIAGLPGVTPPQGRLRPETVAGLVAMLLDLPPEAVVAELVVNTRLEPML